jgi:hypothetical protein
MTSHPYLLLLYLAVNFCVAFVADALARHGTVVRPSRGEVAVFSLAMLLLGVPILCAVIAWQGMLALAGKLRTYRLESLSNDGGHDKQKSSPYPGDLVAK